MDELSYSSDMPQAPRSFWQPIEDAGGDAAQFKKHLLTLERDELIKFYRIYKELELELFSDEHLAHLSDDEETVKETAQWVIMQGEKYYNEVYSHPEKTPSGDDLYSVFLDEMVGVFSDRFNEWISVAAFPAK